jgi:hypothetical protein
MAAADPQDRGAEQVRIVGGPMIASPVAQGFEDGSALGMRCGDVQLGRHSNVCWLIGTGRRPLEGAVAPTHG